MPLAVSKPLKEASLVELYHLILHEMGTAFACSIRRKR